MRPDFPRNLPEFLRRFPDERACFDYVVASRWPDGWACPACGGVDAYPVTSRSRIECRGCAHQTSATAGTIMHRSHLPLSKWLLAAYFVTTDKRGISAKYLGKQLGVGYETAWGMLHKLRAAMVAPGRSKLMGVVEVDETEIGAPKRGRAREDAPERLVVVGAIERRLNPNTGRRYSGRVRFRYLPSGRLGEGILGFVVETVKLGTNVVTDAAPVYTANIGSMGYLPSVESTTLGMKPGDVLPLFHLAVSNLKTWLMGTHHGAASPKHIQSYLNEFAFRFNRRGNPQAAFQTILGIAGGKRGPELAQLYERPAVPPVHVQRELFA